MVKTQLMSKNPTGFICKALKHLCGGKASWLPCYEGVSNWMQDSGGKGLALLGDVGTGKTLFAEQILPVALRRWNIKESKVCSLTALEIAERLPEMSRCDYIIVDDVGMEAATIQDYGNKSTPFQDLVYTADRQGQTLIFTSNLTPQQMAAKYGKRVVDRLHAMCTPVVFTGSSLRGIDRSISPLPCTDEPVFFDCSSGDALAQSQQIYTIAPKLHGLLSTGSVQWARGHYGDDVTDEILARLQAMPLYSQSDDLLAHIDKAEKEDEAFALYVREKEHAHFLASTASAAEKERQAIMQAHSERIKKDEELTQHAIESWQRHYKREWAANS